MTNLKTQIKRSLPIAKKAFEDDYKGIDQLLSNDEFRVRYCIRWMIEQDGEVRAEIETLIRTEIEENENT